LWCPALVYNGSVLAEVGDLEHESFNPPQKPIEAEMLMIALMPPFWQTPVISSLSFSRNIKN
jgi:hypothetical protein